MKNRLIISILILLPIVWFIGLKVSVYSEVKSLFPYSWENLDELEKTPTLLKLNSMTEIQTKEIEFHDLIIEYPNKEIIKDTIGKNGIMFSFIDSSNIIVTYDSHIEGLDYISQLSSIGGELDNKIIKNYFKENKIGTNYQLINHAFSLQPSGISWFDSTPLRLDLHYSG